ncbi:MAG: hypothetical protein HYV34_04745 [Candidatus Kerfeldbacteria bacterium]|nr:hypothetical protein [Candidatus Kerfeldbacteria bacterium]
MAEFEISSRESAILIGTILGDSHLAMLKSGARLEVVHSEKQYAYVWWKYMEFQRVTSAPPHCLYISDKRYKKTYTQWRFKTRVNSMFTHLHHQFYSRKGKKVIPQNISSLLTSPLALAVLYMDDGGRRNDSYGVFLNTLSFTKRENHLLATCLKENFSLEARIHWIQDGYRLYIPSAYAQQFSELVDPYLIPSMKYKLPYNPVTTSFARLDRARDRRRVSSLL